MCAILVVALSSLSDGGRSRPGVRSSTKSELELENKNQLNNTNSCEETPRGKQGVNPLATCKPGARLHGKQLTITSHENNKKAGQKKKKKKKKKEKEEMVVSINGRVRGNGAEKSTEMK
jgi:hypothetical protein